MDSLYLFDPDTTGWFIKSIGAPTAVQEAAWPAIASGKDTLVSAPTGTGKTLSAFLVFIDRLKAQAREGTLKQELQLIYISPLKSLAMDIRENLQRPLSGIFEEERKNAGLLKLTGKELNIGVRTGDTTPTERRKMIKCPPHILITTPESLYLMLTSKSGRSILHTAKAIIIDELHALIDSKRGAHLMLSIARLDKLCPKPLQRIGLSATIEPLEGAAKYLSPETVTIVAPKMQKKVELKITSPLTDTRSPRKDPVWQEIARTVYEHCKNTRSVIAFVEGRAYTEKLAYYVNELGGEGFARTHHGSLSKEQRQSVEGDLREGKLRLLCATSSMELGIDVGEIDQVFQIGCPRSISSTMQRLGRAGHNPNRVSTMYLFPRTAVEGLYSGLTAEVVRRGGIEYLKPPMLCLDVLAQHLVSMACGEAYNIDEVMEILVRAYPFTAVTREDVKKVLEMLAGDYEHEQTLPIRPRILYDRIHERVEGDTYSRMLAISAGGTIPDKGMYTAKTENGVKLGELEEEFVFESRVGDRFLLGTFTWQIKSIQKDAVIVAPSQYPNAKLPFWKGEMKGRRMQTGLAFGSILRELENANKTDTLLSELLKLGLDDTAARGAQDFLRRQLKSTGILPNDHTILMEHFRDETGNQQIMVHSVFGRQVNAPLSILAREAAARETHTNICCVEDDDGFLLFPYSECVLPEGLLYKIAPDTAVAILEAVLPSTPLFNMTFRYNTAHALMMGVRKSGRQPLWVQRLRSAEMLDALVKQKDHPLIRETKRECLEDYWDLEGALSVLQGIQSGSIQVCEMYLDHPSPMSFLLRQQTEASMMYDYTPTPRGVWQSATDALNQVEMIAPAPEQLALAGQRSRLPADERQLHSLLMMEGDLIAGELAVPIDWLETLAKQELALYIEPGLWIAAEHFEKYQAALINTDENARTQIVLRLLRYRGAVSASQLSDRYLWPEQTSYELLNSLCRKGEVVENNGLYYHAQLYNQARHATIKSRRNQMKTLPPQCYSALLAGRMRIIASPGEQLAWALKQLSEQTYPPALWEGVLLPARVNGYRPELLDTLLAQGDLFWQLHTGTGLSFHRYDDIDWDFDLQRVSDTLEGNEKALYDGLQKRGASFMQRLSGLIGGASPFEPLLAMAEKGLVYADSFLPIRQLEKKEKLLKSSLKLRISARAKAMTSGRWELSRPLLPLSAQELLERAFDRVIIVSRETLQNLSWNSALQILRVWEYTGRVRRGYFIEGLSGIQFIRDKDFADVMKELEQPRKDIVWMSAIDPMQPWGKYLQHMPDRSFLNIPGNAVALCFGIPVAVIERQGKVLRVFEEAYLTKALQSFVQDYAKCRIFPTLNRLVVKQYPPEAKEALAGSGFLHELQDYVLYR